MEFVERTDGRGTTWEINPPEIGGIINSYAYAKALMQKIRLVQRPAVGDSFWQSLGMTTASVDFKEGDVKVLQTEFFDSCVPKFRSKFRTNGRDAFDYLVKLREDTIKFRNQKNSVFQSVASHNQETINLATIAEEQVKAWRDVSLTCVSVVIAVQGGVVAVVGATVLAGENSAFKYRESGSVEQAILAGTGSLLQVGWGLVGGALDKGYKMGKGAIIGLSLITDTGFEVAGKSMEGKKGSELVKAATIKSLAGALGNVLPAAIEKKFGEAVEEITARTDLDRMIAEVGAGAGLKSLEIRMGADDAPLPAGVERRTALPGSIASAATAFVNRRAFKRHPVHKH